MPGVRAVTRMAGEPFAVSIGGAEKKVDLVEKVMLDLAKRFAKRPGGYTRIIKFGPRRGDNKIKQFAGMPVSWIPTTWVYKEGDLRYALNYGEVRFDVLKQFIDDSKSEWSHKGEPKLPE